MPVIVCLGNPPYDRTKAVDDTNKARTGHWVRWGDDGKGHGAIFKDFLDPAVAAGHGVRVKNLYNLYVYFWRWALWKVFESKTAAGPGVVSFISASSYLDGDAFCGMREHMRRLCDEIWILDLGGEGRGTRKSENVFAIQTPVAIAVAVRYGKAKKKTPAKVHYARIDGTRDEKLKALDAIAGFALLGIGRTAPTIGKRRSARQARQVLRLAAVDRPVSLAAVRRQGRGTWVICPGCRIRWSAAGRHCACRRRTSGQSRSRTRPRAQGNRRGKPTSTRGRAD